MLRVSTWNVLDLFAPLPTDDARARYARKVNGLAEKLRAIDADVIGLQEVGTEEALAPLLESLVDRGYVAHLGTPDDRGIRCALLSRLPIIAAVTHTADHLPFPALAAGDPPPFGQRIPLRRGVPHVAIATPLGPVHFLVAHLKSSRAMLIGEVASARARGEGIARSLVWRSAEALFIRGVCDEIRAQSPGIAVVAMGDFNDVESSAPLSILASEGDDRLVSATARVPLPKRFTSRHGGERRQIDHVLVTPELATHITGALAWNEGLVDPTERGVRIEDLVSDHAPLVVDFA
jgi:endonuclease/exonuclease/phosphatase family metal-dependent hydrolase